MNLHKAREIAGVCILSLPFLCILAIPIINKGWVEGMITNAIVIAATALIAVCVIVGVELIDP